MPPLFVALITALCAWTGPLAASQEATLDGQTAALPSGPVASEQPAAIPLYGQTTGKRVRLRVQPQLDAPIVQELKEATPLEISGTFGEFYEVKPPFAFKAYLFRTYVLDGVVEGDKVNVRLEPSSQGTILTQLHRGHRVVGQPSAINSKWLEIQPPQTIRFYVSRDYVQLIEHERYVQLVSQSPHLQAPLSGSTQPSNAPLAQASPFASIEQQLQQGWLAQHQSLTESDYQAWLKESAVWLEGSLASYSSAQQAPGDFVLKSAHRILAFVYSPTIDLGEHLGKSVRLRACQRDNLGFAYPAYCVVEVQ